jgi:hypothetical protein
LQSGAETPRRRAPWWVFLVAGSYLGYFAMLVYCDIRRPETPGMTVSIVESSIAFPFVSFAWRF